MPIELPHSSFLDYDSSRSAASLPTNGTVATSFAFNVALVLERAADATPLLEANWATRQQQLAGHTYDGLWQTYGANQANYNAVLNDLPSMHIQTVDQVDPANGYTSSVYSRTIWVHVDQTNFSTLFGTDLMQGTTSSGAPISYWTGNLSLPNNWVTTYGVKGLYFDTESFTSLEANPGSGPMASLPQGAQSLGNSTSSSQVLYPQQIAQTYYNFPLTGALWNPASGSAVTTGTIGLLEPGTGNMLGSNNSTAAEFDALLAIYRNGVGIGTPGVVVNVAPGGQVPPSIGERSLDVGVVTAINPQSPMVLYAGSGWNASAVSDGYTAYQQAIWDNVNNPEVVSSSYRFGAAFATAGSPFLFAANELFVDAALANMTILSSSGDGGSSMLVGNGFPNVSSARGSPYGIMVGGTSLSPLVSASQDTTLGPIVAAALAGDKATIWDLVAGGLTTLPSSLPTSTWEASQLIEAVWNTYELNGTTFAGNGYAGNLAGNGGVDQTRLTPSYQLAFGLHPASADPAALQGRGAPDVAANSGGNMYYLVPQQDMNGLHRDAGTSAATPLWAALISQFNAIFNDQGLPDLGYANDLLYIAAAIAPGSFNDVTRGNNISSYVLGGPYSIADTGEAITPTGYGYHATPGYDLATGLGSPNGVLLGRALTAIAHSQMSFSTSPDMLDNVGRDSWTSGDDQRLIFQTMSGTGVTVDVGLGGDSLDFASGASGAFAWTNRLAQQSLQPDFDPNLVRMFDKHAHGAIGHAFVSSGESLSVGIDGMAAHAIQGTLTTSFGFADFVSADGVVRVARPVAVAETAGGANDTTAIVRLRQNGEDSLTVSFYKVDDLAGNIDGLAPGQAGYASLAAQRSYHLTSGGTALNGPGYGNYGQSGLLGVDAGDRIAMKLIDNSSGQTYWAFAQANESVGGGRVAHLWNYGLNTWGCEDTHGGGDRDFNDLIVQLDFTSTAGHGWLA